MIIHRAEIINITLALRTTKYLYEEKEYIPWESAIRNLEYFFLMFDRTEVYGPLQVCLFTYYKKYYYYMQLIHKKLQLKNLVHRECSFRTYQTLILTFINFFKTLQTYLRGKVQPLFEHFKEITSDWTQKPQKYMDQ